MYRVAIVGGLVSVTGCILVSVGLSFGIAIIISGVSLMISGAILYFMPEIKYALKTNLPASVRPQ